MSAAFGHFSCGDQVTAALVELLGHEIEYSPHLPLIDRLFESFAETEADRPSALSKVYQQALEDAARKIWDIAPWELLADSDILRVELKNCPIDEVYLCIMGMMSAEYGVLLYRSLDSLKQFRAAALGTDRSPAELEQAFLAQDCWFLNYEVDSEAKSIENRQIESFFGSLHPFEGMRPFLDEEEAKIIYAVLNGLARFCDRHQTALTEEPIEAISQSYRINLAFIDDKKQTISTKVSTLPQLTEELLDIGKSSYPDFLDGEIDIPIREDFVPDGSLVILTAISLETIEQVKQQQKTYHQFLNNLPQRSELPAIFIQTTRPKAKQLIDRIQDAGGLKSICFNPGENQFTGECFNLGMLQTGDEELHIFAEYSQEDPEHIEIVEDWHQICELSHGNCLLIVAMGSTGNNRGNPQVKDILGCFEVKSIDGSDIGMGVLELLPNLEL